MQIIDANDLRFEVLREVGPDQGKASAIANRYGGVLVQDTNSGKYLVCQQIIEAEFDEITEEATEADD